MPYQANVVQVMIASPGDVVEERDLIRRTLYDWNATYASNQLLVMLPVSWETHSSPAYGDRPQAIINKQLLDQCDLLVAAFWTRVGSPTGVSASGTIEEITRHVDAKKPAMLYFSNAPVRMESVDENQVRELKQFKDFCRSRSLYEAYDSIEDFRAKLTRQFAQTVVREYGNLIAQGAASSSSSAVPEAPSLSDEAQTLLVEAAGGDGHVMCIGTLGGLIVQANRKNLNINPNPRAEAKWKAAIRDLTNIGLLESVGHKGEVFQVTAAGYEVADKLRQSGPAA